MKQIIKEYLRSLTERGQLEVVLCRLLSNMGLSLISEPGRGTTQKGVDILARGKVAQDLEETLFILTVKMGNVTRANWSGGEQKVRESLQQIIDSYIPHRLNPDEAALRKRICVCFGGDISEHAKEDAAGFYKIEKAHLELENAKIELWNGDEIAKLICEYLVSPDLLLGEGRKYLIKTLAMAEEPETATNSFKAYLVNCLECSNDKISAIEVVRTLRQVSMALELVHSYCVQVDNLDASFRSSELAVLLSWQYLCSHDGVLDKCRSKAHLCFNDIWLQYFSIAGEFVDKVSRAVDERYQLMLACLPNTEIDANKKVFDLIGRLSSFGESVLFHYHVVSKSARQITPEGEASFEVLLNKTRDCLVKLIKNNPTAEMPLEDSYSFEIGAAACFLIQMGNAEFVKGWIEAMLGAAVHNLRLRRGFPYHGLPYLDVIARASKSWDAEDEMSMPKSSTLYPMLMLIATSNGWSEIYESCRMLHAKFLPTVDFQLWYPQSDSIDGLIKGVIVYTPHGLSLTSLDVTKEERFRDSIFEECDNSPLRFGFLQGPYAGLLFIACRVSRYPLPPHYLRAIHDQLNNKNVRGDSPPLHGKTSEEES